MAALRLPSIRRLLHQSARRFSYDVSFKGQRAVVTGGTKGIGRATSIALAELGADVVAIGRSDANLGHERITGMQCDLGNLDATTAAFNDIGDVDLLVNNAGIAYLAPFLDHDMTEFQRVMDVNVTAAAIVSKACAKSMIVKGKGAIVNVSSQASQVGLDDHTAYCVSKGAMDQLTRMMAVELGPHQVGWRESACMHAFKRLCVAEIDVKLPCASMYGIRLGIDEG
eukprot:TRINITY_DN9627_c0_g3_i2.p1 TRINITY_DN9627_c0_g3~~TRINITY_DN9627_c0_g3_i2.p1  ORF type:complete len:240 (+),score=35.89 TRINITY_DN9627_c0_g3_i2:45-722(+)